jgi:hypothetical protein
MTVKAPWPRNRSRGHVVGARWAGNLAAKAATPNSREFGIIAERPPVRIADSAKRQ